MPEVFPHENLTGLTSRTMKRITASSMVEEIAKYADIINMSCNAPEDGHIFWIKEPGGNRNQGPEATLTMMHHSLWKEASALLCEGVQGSVLSSIT